MPKLSCRRRLRAGSAIAVPLLWYAFDWPMPFTLVFREELRQIEARRDLAKDSDGEEKLSHRFSNVHALGTHKQLFGVAFSGGGIRSATFNLGVCAVSRRAEAAEAGSTIFSTVSGGGYIGAWLAGRIWRNNDISKIQDELSPLITPDPRASGQKPIKFLREFSNYLTPFLGTFSFDIWTMAAVYTRNVILNQAVLFSVFAAILLIPRFLAFPLYDNFCNRYGDLAFMTLASILLLISVLCISIDLNVATQPAEATNPAQPADQVAEGTGVTSNKDTLVRWLAVFPMLLAAYCGSIWMWRSQWVPHQFGAGLDRQGLSCPRAFHCPLTRTLADGRLPTLLSEPADRAGVFSSPADHSYGAKRRCQL